MVTYTAFTRVVTRCSAPVLVLSLILAIAEAQGTPLTAGPGLESAFVVPLKYDPITNQVPTVKVRINHSEPLVFIIDTGTPFPLIVDEWAAQQLKLLHVAEPEPFGSFYGPKKGFSTAISSLAFVGLTGDKSVSVDLRKAAIINLGSPADLVEGPRIAGIVGAPILATYLVQLDFAAKTLTLLPPSSGQTQPSGSWTLPLIDRDGHYFARAYFGGRGEIAVELDTGSVHVQIPWAAALASSPIATGEHVMSKVVGGATFKVLMLPNVRVDGLTEPDVAIYTNKSPDTLGLLGMDFLRRFRVTLNLRDKQVILQRATDYSVQVRRQPALRCLFTVARDGKYYVSGMLAGTAPATAGLLPGDRLLTVDGRTLDGMNYTPGEGLIIGYAGEQAKVEVLRNNGQRIQVTYKRPSIFQTHPREGAGLQIDMENDGRLYVTGVTPSSPAQEAGLRIGDEVVEVNHKAARDMALKDITAAFMKPVGGEIVLKVLSTGEPKPREVTLQKRKLPWPEW